MGSTSPCTVTSIRTPLLPTSLSLPLFWDWCLSPLSDVLTSSPEQVHQETSVCAYLCGLTTGCSQANLYLQVVAVCPLLSCCPAVPVVQCF